MLLVALHPGWIDRFTTSEVIADDDVDEDDENDYENEKPLMFLSLT